MDKPHRLQFAKTFTARQVLTLFYINGELTEFYRNCDSLDPKADVRMSMAEYVYDNASDGETTPEEAESFIGAWDFDDFLDVLQSTYNTYPRI